MSYASNACSSICTTPSDLVSRTRSKTMKIGGVTVDFCYPPYPGQITMMDQVIKSVTRHKNCLIESPTGSGKTLALLSSALAWQKFEHVKLTEAKVKAEKELLEQQLKSLHDHTESSEHDQSVPAPGTPKSLSPNENKIEPMETDNDDAKYMQEDNGTAPWRWAVSAPKPVKQGSSADSDDDDFEAGKVHPCTSTLTNSQVEQRRRSCQSGPDNHFNPPITVLPEPDISAQSINEKCPKVFYGTRTHKQVAHIISELNKTEYTDVKYTILASREQSCIHPVVSKERDKTSACREILKDSSCSYQQHLKKQFDQPYKLRRILDPAQMSQLNVNRKAWDIEDLVHIARNRSSFCPYFASTRVLLRDAQLVICPYNYLIDPIIRKSMELNLDNNVVILDEAHNIEDVCRDAATFKFTMAQFEDAARNYRVLYNHYENSPADDGPLTDDEMKEMAQHYKLLHSAVYRVVVWLRHLVEHPKMKSQSSSSNRSYQRRDVSDEDESGIWDGIDIHASMQALHDYEQPLVTPHQLLSVLSALEKTNSRSTGMSSAEEDEGRRGTDESDLPVANTSTLLVLEQWLQFATFFVGSEIKYQLVIPFGVFFVFQLAVISVETTDFNPNLGCRMCVTRSHTSEPIADYDPNRMEFSHNTSGWINVHQINTSAHLRTFEITANMWCMDPALAFEAAFSSSRSVILASGTLCPTETFKTELGVPFDLCMEGAHVIPKEQVFAAALTQGPTGQVLRAVYDQTNQEAFKDELGRLVYHVCATVPGGVLCFFPSYRVMQTVTAQWQDTNMWTSLSKIKLIIEEPRSSQELNAVIQTFNQAIANPTHFGGNSMTGALLMAICRGKVSEGMDFADEHARAVITVGIPYPNLKDMQVEQKRMWNDKQRIRQQSLTGKRWYEVQAFRALNQALGRCIRHKNDWGALIMVDQRFVNDNHINKNYEHDISRWVRRIIQPHDKFGPFIQQLGQFVQRMQDNDQQKPQNKDSSYSKVYAPGKDYLTDDSTPNRNKPLSTKRHNTMKSTPKRAIIPSMFLNVKTPTDNKLHNRDASDLCYKSPKPSSKYKKSRLTID